MAGSPAEDITAKFLWVPLPIVAVPWGCVFVNYIYNPKEDVIDVFSWIITRMGYPGIGGFRDTPTLVWTAEINK
jgi:hypothetical protein